MKDRQARRHTTLLLSALLAASCGSKAPNHDLVDVFETFTDWYSDSEIAQGPPCQTDEECGAGTPCIVSAQCIEGHCVVIWATAGAACWEGCYSEGKCSTDGLCIGSKVKECTESDGNPCTEPSCDFKSGECVEKAQTEGSTPYISSDCWEGAVCLNGQLDTTNAQPSPMALECKAQAEDLNPMGCIDDIICVGGQERCRPLLKSNGVECWKEGDPGNEVCRGRSCQDGECKYDPSLDVSCEAQDLPDSCGPGCQACTTLSCHWIPDPANPTAPTLMLPYCRPNARIGEPCADNPCQLDQVCSVGSQTNGPMGKETLGSCGGGTALTTQACALKLSKPELPCIMAGIGCSPDKGGCYYDSALASQWCWPAEGSCFNKETTTCSHLAAGETWDPATGCDVDWVQLNCNDQNDCTVDSCKASGEGWGCIHQPLSGTACDDGDLCTVGGKCTQGECTGSIPACTDDDGNPCNDRRCDAATGECLPPATNGMLCDDGNACTLDDYCKETNCQPGTELPCDDADVCNGLESCDPAAGCQPGQPLQCLDADPCNGVETCDKNVGCKPGTALNCADTTLCNGNETCESGVGCVPGLPLACDDGNPCNGIETCDPAKGCQDGTPLVCSDNNLCNGIESCSPSKGCQDGTPLTCADSNLCNGTETCNPTTGCQPGAPLACDNGNTCDGEEYCSPSLGCLSGDPLVCNDGNVCNGTETCDPLGGCKPGVSLVCNDNNLCNGTETCSPTAGCQPGTTLVCNNGNACDGVETCDAELGCLPGIALVCDDGDLCNGAESCSSLLGCQAGIPLTCLDTNLCNGTETCDMQLGCMPGTPLDCTDQNVCNGTEGCNPATGCTAGNPLNCVDTNPCTADSCNTLLGCQNPNVADGTGCPGGAAYKCTAGQCICVPQCAGIQCGNDLCGGSCGTCTSPDTCVLGLCQPAGIDPEGTFDLSPDQIYSCAGGMSYNIQTLTIVENGGAVTVIFYPSMCAPLTGTWNPTTKKVTAGTDACWNGDCQHNYAFYATFTDNNTFTATFIATPQFVEFGYCPGCVKQNKSGLAGTRL